MAEGLKSLTKAIETVAEKMDELAKTQMEAKPPVEPVEVKVTPPVQIVNMTSKSMIHWHVLLFPILLMETLSQTLGFIGLSPNQSIGGGYIRPKSLSDRVFSRSRRYLEFPEFSPEDFSNLLTLQRFMFFHK